MTIKIDPEDLERVTKALMHYYHYLISQARSEERYRVLAEQLESLREKAKLKDPPTLF